MEAGDGAAGNGDKKEREELAFDDGAPTVHELREGRELDVGVNNEYTQDQQNDCPQLHISGEIVAGFEQ